jgi:Xaa-Pro aminopeptidase
MVEAWHRSDQAAQALLRPGTKVSDLYAAQIKAVEDSGFISPLEAGHDLGLDAHESITVEAASPVVLQAGMVLAVHACVMQKVAGDGVGMGYTYLITENGAERFSRVNLAEELL